MIPPLGSSNPRYTAAVTTMVVQPVTASGNTPENPGINPLWKRIAPSGPNTAERREWSGLKSVPVCLYHKTNLSAWQVDSLLTLRFFTWCMSKSPRSDCFWVRPPVAHIEVICDRATPPDGSELPIPVKELLITAKGFRSNISEKPHSLQTYLGIIVLFR